MRRQSMRYLQQRDRTVTGGRGENKAAEMTCEVAMWSHAGVGEGTGDGGALVGEEGAVGGVIRELRGGAALR